MTTIQAIPGFPCYAEIKETAIAGCVWTLFTEDGQRLDDGDCHAETASALLEATNAAQFIYTTRHKPPATNPNQPRPGDGSGKGRKKECAGRA